MAGQAGGFEFTTAHNGEVSITHHGHHAATLRGSAARKFLADVETADAQALMARVTGNYRRGNERTAKNHPRNAGRRR
ncbi:hypothetical protein JOF48_001707 [Arthrobacter stackebrandtii]|uniref:DUF2188 domain-containing protein n=1 Tax=Arthrobacter stackebrandtii TaxID=272161 RepID=A0ABS4YVU5_9MICC|nr:hypothetical protein [Arthrobacter stackebrandtii]MBP2412908.1 hypothetical protein [Arthrobacter stackebrandtii]PYH01286.1 hypothetical protein CVV67_06905 [Arthrobacter stackebrandtii]